MLIKNVFIGLFAMTIFSATLIAQEEKSYSLDDMNSTMTWKGYKVTGDHTGLIDLQSATIDFVDGNLTSAVFEINMTSIVCTDLEGKGKAGLEGHLKSDDFFGVEKYPTAKFESTRIIPRGTPGDYKVIGNLTIKESTEEIKFYVNVLDDVDAGTLTATADLTIDRTDYDVKYGSGSFFDGLKDKTIYDEFDLGIELMIKK